MKVGPCIICLEKGSSKRKSCKVCNTLFHVACQRKFSTFCVVCKTNLKIKGTVNEYVYEEDEAPVLTRSQLNQQRRIMAQIEEDYARAVSNISIEIELVTNIEDFTNENIGYEVSTLNDDQ